MLKKRLCSRMLSLSTLLNTALVITVSLLIVSLLLRSLLLILLVVILFSMLPLFLITLVIQRALILIRRVMMMSKIVINGYRVRPMTLFNLDTVTDEDLDEVLTHHEATSISKDIEEPSSVTDEGSVDQLPTC